MAVQRKQLKRPDAFVKTGRKWLEWSVTNQRTLAFAGVGLLAVVLLIAGVLRYRTVQERQANEDLALALSTFKSEQWEDAAQQMREVATRWSGKGVGILAHFYAAQADLEAGAHERARDAFLELSERSGTPAYLRQQALVGLAYLAAEGGDDAEAAARYAAAAKIDGPYTGMALLGEARARESLGERDVARALYERFVAEFPNAGERPVVEAILAGM